MPILELQNAKIYKKKQKLVKLNWMKTKAKGYASQVSMIKAKIDRTKQLELFGL